jgi:hypothetical protein
MFQSLMLFLAPAAPSATRSTRATQAVQPSPPAVARLAPAEPGRRGPSIFFLARVIGSAIGFAALFSGCWLTLQLLQAFL